MNESLRFLNLLIFPPQQSNSHPSTSPFSPYLYFSKVDLSSPNIDSPSSFIFFIIVHVLCFLPLLINISINYHNCQTLFFYSFFIESSNRFPTIKLIFSSHSIIHWCFKHNWASQFTPYLNMVAMTMQCHWNGHVKTKRRKMMGAQEQEESKRIKKIDKRGQRGRRKGNKRKKISHEGKWKRGGKKVKMKPYVCHSLVDSLKMICNSLIYVS